MYNSEFCTVEYMEKDRIVLLTWKKFCCKENYRTPVSYALGLIEKNKNTSLVIDARRGFEDEKEDVEWGFKVFMPKLSRADCMQVIFIMKEINDIKEEMDLWTKEFKKYFKVSRVTSLDEAKALLKMH